MSIITSDELEASPLADLHALASTLGIDGFRRLRRADLVAAIVAQQSGEQPPQAADAGGDGQSPSARGRRRRRGRARDGDPDEAGPRTEAAPRAESARRTESAPAEQRMVEGVVELLANGSGFVRPDGANGSDNDVYISAAQARRCELVAGDRVSGPVRPARRSERHPSLIRIDTINGLPADEAVHGARIDDIEVDWPATRLLLDATDELLAAIDVHAPIGAGSRAVITGPSRSGKSRTLAAIAAALAPVKELEVELLPVGVRPEELGEYRALAYFAGTGSTFAASRDVQDAALDQAVERGRRVAVRGGNAVLLIDSLDGVSESAARRALASARNLRGAGALTIIATATSPLGGETTVIALTAGTPTPTLDTAASGTLRAELLSAPEPKRAAPKPRTRKPAVRKPKASPPEETPDA